MKWVDNRCNEMLREYAEEYDVLEEGECLLPLMEWRWRIPPEGGILLVDAFGIQEDDGTVVVR